MPMLFRKKLITAKIETTYGIDSVPTGAANAILVRNMEITPIEMETEERDTQQAFLGNSGKVVTAFWGSLAFETELQSSGAAGTAPKFGVLLRACSLAEAVVAVTSVTYTPVSTGFESVSMYFYLDGVLHRFLGTRGTPSFQLNARSIPVIKYNFMGLFQPVTDVALPAATYAQAAPLAVSKANTPTFTLHGITAVCNQLTVDMANEVKYRNLINYEAMDNIDRQPGGSFQIEANLMAVKNWFTTARDQATGALNIVHGTAAGAIVQIQAPNTKIVAPRYQEVDGVAMLSGSLSLEPGASGNDEFTIQFR